MMRRLWLMPVICFLMLGPGMAGAHDVQPLFLEVKQTDATHLSVTWKVPASAEMQKLAVAFPSQWKIVSGPTDSTLPGNVLKQWNLFCPPGGLDGQTLGVTGLEDVPADVMVRIVRQDGTATMTRLNPTMTSFVIAPQPGFLHLAATYTRLGIEHILTGVDHLLFVLGLLLIVKNRWTLIETITAFTIAHSLTLAVATLGYASAPVNPLYVAIALSIFFLGPEIVRKKRGGTSLTIEHPWIIAFIFGLVHGFGFAAGLTALGLTHKEIPPALLLFNVGVEIGQLFFVLIILSLERAYKVLDVHWSKWAQWIPTYAIGSLGAFWTIQRVAILFGWIPQ